jgi:hypothetical protein
MPPQVDLRSYRRLSTPWNDLNHLVARGRHWAQILATVALVPAGGSR